MWELLKQGGVVMYPLGVCSLITIGIFIERLWRFSRADRSPQQVLARAERVLASGGQQVLARAERVLASGGAWPDAPAPAERVAGAALEKAGAPRTAVENHMQAALAAEGLRLSAHLGIVGTIGNIAPFIGLFGTVLGIIRAFRDIRRWSPPPRDSSSPSAR